MSELLATTATRPPAFRDHTDLTASDRRRSRVWTVIQALAYADAFIDPSGILAVERLRQAKEEERNDRR
jgi:hypothetical protein